MKAHAFFFKRQAAVLQNARYLTFKIGDRFFVMHIQYFAWQNFIPVIHCQDIFFVILR